MKRLDICQDENDEAGGSEALTRTANHADGNGLAEKGFVYDLLYSGAASQMEPALRDCKGAVFFSENIAFAKGGTEGKWVLGCFVVRVREIEVIYWVQRGRVL